MKKEKKMSEWRAFLNEGSQYLKAARGKNGNPSRLSNDIRYNLLGLSFEKSMMAILMYHNDMADNHTFADLVHSVSRHITITPLLCDEIVALEQVQSICNLYEYHRELPSDSVVARLTDVAVQIFALASEVCAVSGEVVEVDIN